MHQVGWISLEVKLNHNIAGYYIMNNKFVSFKSRSYVMDTDRRDLMFLTELHAPKARAEHHKEVNIPTYRRDKFWIWL